MKILIHHFEKNAHAILRFGKNAEILGIYDEREKFNGIDPGEYLGLGKTNIKITNNFDDLLERFADKADMLVTTGEGLYFTKEWRVREWKEHIIKAIKKGLDIYTMSKIYYGEETNELKTLAKKHGVKFIEASDPNAFEKYEKYALMASEEGIKTPVVNFTGTSMNSGKSTAMFTILSILKKRGMKVGIIGTEPSSYFLDVDEQVIPEVLPTMRGAQVIMGAIKKIEVEKEPNIILVGSQTGLRAPVIDVKEGRAGAIVAWQILLGSAPSKIVLCSKWNRIKELEPHMNLIKYSINRPIIGIVINGFGASEDDLSKIINDLRREFNLPVVDVISNKEELEELIDRLVK